MKPRRHLEVDLFTTFEHEKRYHLLSRWADGGNLDNLWRTEHPVPEITYEKVCWLAQQCQGLAFGLEGVHNTKMTAEDVEAFGFQPASPTSSQTDGSPSTTGEDDHGKDYGRHGDIKPQNILWFKQDSNRYNLGMLKLSDFGLTTFHHAQTTQVTPRNIRVTPTYSAPEREIDEKLSRPFDIWSLGCIFLEFITWVLLGAEGLDGFSQKRTLDGGSRDPRISLDNFYTVIKEGDRTHAVVKPSVLSVSNSKPPGNCIPKCHISGSPISSNNLDAASLRPSSSIIFKGECYCPIEGTVFSLELSVSGWGVCSKDVRMIQAMRCILGRRKLAISSETLDASVPWMIPAMMVAVASIGVPRCLQNALARAGDDQTVVF